MVDKPPQTIPELYEALTGRFDAIDQRLDIHSKMFELLIDSLEKFTGTKIRRPAGWTSGPKSNLPLAAKGEDS